MRRATRGGSRRADGGIRKERRRAMRWAGWSAIAVTLSGVTLWVAGCEMELEPRIDDAQAVEWVEYVSEELGVRLEHPAHWRVEESGNTIRFVGDVATAMRVTLVDPEEARERGLWGRSEIVRIDTAGVLAWRFYRYRHYDGPVYVPTLAFVVRHRGKELGIEFRTRSADAGEVEKRVLATVRLIGE